MVTAFFGPAKQKAPVESSGSVPHVGLAGQSPLPIPGHAYLGAYGLKPQAESLNPLTIPILLRLRYGGNPLSAGGNESIEFIGLLRLEFPGDVCGFCFQLARLRLKLLDFRPITGLHCLVSSHILISELRIGFDKSIYFRRAEGRDILGQHSVGRCQERQSEQTCADSSDERRPFPHGKRLS